MNFILSFKEKIKEYFSEAKGFSIFEMLVVISIMVLLSALAINYDRTSEDQIRIYREQSRVVSVINRAKSLTLERYNAGDVEGELCGIGVKFDDPKEFTLFQDVHDGDCDDSNNRYDSGEELDSFMLDDGVEFTGQALENIEVLFLAPHLDTESNRTFPVDIDLISDRSGETRTISLSASGQITIQ